MSYTELAKEIPTDLREKTANGLIDLLLNSQNASKLSSNLARSVLRHWENDQLATESGLAVLLEASMLLEPQKILETCAGLGLSQVGDALKARSQA